MTPWMRKIHRWIGLLIGIQLVLWMSSGVVMSLLNSDKVRGSEFRVAKKASAPTWPEDTLPAEAVLAAARLPVHAISTGWLLDRPIYKLAAEKDVRMVDARQGQAIELTADVAQRLAAASYTGAGKPLPAELVERSLETRAHEGRFWRVAFSDAEATTVYLSQQGDVLEHRNDTWRLFDFFWMLHIMDYSWRKDFNNPLVIGAAVGGLWLALSGIWLLMTSFRLAEFVPRRWRGQRELAVYAPDGVRLRTLPVAIGDTVFATLARQGLHLPSNCGGGQSCGLCHVRVKGRPPKPTAADRAQLSEGKLREGHRLACNLMMDDKLAVEVSGGADQWNEQTAVVESVRALTPFLREIVLKPQTAPGADFHPGAYLQVHVPAYTMERRQLVVPASQAAEWAALDLPERWHNKAPLRRSYSLACPVEQANGRITILPRLCHAKTGRKSHPPGKGSAYLYSLAAGDVVRFSGPFGDFAIIPGGREKVFIGGGAGMAPLRAMILALLAGGAKEPIHFWYGARTGSDTPYRDELTALAARHGNFKWQLVLSALPPGSPEAAVAPTGMVHDIAAQALKFHGRLDACDFYVCGPPAMLAATRVTLRKLGVGDERVAFDDFKI
ncbi:MAG: 2Fe-2S iron-sulfur cluster-binding protein [Rubrivivax sp.]|jgi:Na+-transporting NADH:ubiquinone oxidoreductase subunit F|nr:2Fe-2S iron-sulfur cluster-binding protein [Rubrivivax sp.]